MSQRSAADARSSAAASSRSTAPEPAMLVGPSPTGSRALTRTRVRLSLRESNANRREFDELAVFESRPPRKTPLGFGMLGS